MGRWKRPEEFEAQAARIENISQGGAKIVTADPPVLSERIWLRVVSASCSDCVQGTVLEVATLATGDYASRLSFETPCPLRLLQTIAQGNIPSPHFRVPSPGERVESRIGSGRLLTRMRPSSIIPHLSSRSRNPV